MSIEADPEKAIGMSAWRMQKEANMLQQYAWVDDNFKDPRVQAVIDFTGDRSTGTCADFYDLVIKVREAAGGIYIGSSSIHHGCVSRLEKFIMLKAEQQKKVRAMLKKEKIEKLQKEIADLEG